jgi:hypothetical protein
MTRPADLTDRELLLQLLGSLTLCDHMGDVADDVLHVIRQLGIPTSSPTPFDGIQLVEGGWRVEVRATLRAMGVRTLYGTSLDGDEPEEDEDE